ncbi:unnamed protein product [Hermetia illucens]|uniref:CHK kinase-like domain-containing protein n=1 Tax=Hermetia illucens TaxID=343691 RepID=A0A7R8V6D2_HERIL|nr:uncharacterized protein LOC119660401 [Hermetia illucens]CAD7093740.1 unnamed protein product [Hermetia illucens]
MSFNADELEAPEWVNSNFLKEVLEYNGDVRNVTTHDYKISPATTLGDHFASIMFRANIRFSTQDQPSEKRSIIIKTLPVVEGFKKDMLSKTEVDFFGTEIFMYSKVLSECANMLKNAGYNDLLAPKMIYQSSEPYKVIVFEDLKELGYFMFPRTIPNEEDTKLIFSKLGQYHAATFKLAAEGHKGLNLKGSIFNMGNMENKNFLQDGITYFKEVLETLPEFKEASEKLSKISFGKIVEKCIQTINAPGSYEVLNHGDYHIKNMMFKGNNNKDISKVILVDFQICHWGSPAYDLVYMSAILPPGMRPGAYRHYFDTFIDVLEKSGYKGSLPVFEQLQKDLKSHRILDLFLLSTFTAFICADKKEINEQMETLFQDTSRFKIFYRQPNYISYVKELLPDLLQEGVLDDLINFN